MCLHCVTGLEKSIQLSDTMNAENIYQNITADDYFHVTNFKSCENLLTFRNKSYISLGKNVSTFTTPYFPLKHFIPETCTVFLIIASIISNFLVITSSGLILKSKVQPWTTHMFLGNLALADILYGIICFGVTKFKPQIRSEIFACLFMMGLGTCYALECSLNVCLIAVDRYIYIRHGLHYTRWMTSRRARYLLAATWVFSLVTGLVIELLFGDYSNNGCTYFGVTPFFGLILIGVMGLTPNLITIVLYVLIFITAFKVVKNKENKDDFKNLSQENVLNKNISVFSQSNKVSSITFIADNENVFKEKRNSQEKNTVTDISYKTLNVDNVHNQNNCKKDFNDKNSVVKFSIIKTDEHTTDIYKINFESDNSVSERTQNPSHSSVRNKSNNTFKKRGNSKIKVKTICYKSSMILFLALSAFTVSWSPCFICVILYTMSCNALTQSDVCSSLENILAFLSFNLGLINALLNPIIYCLGHTGFRKSFLKIFCKKAIREKRRNDFVAALKKHQIFERV